jgi:electron transfer flavoprotein beta subunit
MHIVVCIKHVPDPDAPWVQFSIDSGARAVVALPGVRWLVSPFDEQALEAALQVREALGEARITVLTVGTESCRAALKHGLAMGADDGLLLCDPAFDVGDAWTTSLAISAAVRKLGAPELVLTGRQAADWDSGVVGGAIGELLDWPVISFAAQVDVSAGEVRVRRVVEDGIDTVHSPLPAVVTVSNELGKPRSPNLRETMRAARKPTTVWSARDLGLQAAQMQPRTARESVFAPSREQNCEFIAGATASEQAAGLLDRLRTAKLI